LGFEMMIGVRIKEREELKRCVEWYDMNKKIN
jgi:hypothetical protein